MWVLLGAEIKAKEFSRDGVPEAGGREGIVGIHLVLKTHFVVVDLLEIVYDLYIALDGRLLLAHGRLLTYVHSFLPFLFLVLAFSLVHSL